MLCRRRRGVRLGAPFARAARDARRPGADRLGDGERDLSDEPLRSRRARRVRRRRHGLMRLRSAPHRQIGIPALLAKNRLERLAIEADAKPGDEKKRFSMHSFGAQFAEVRVDPELGEIRVSRFVGAYAAGRILNMKTARSQAIGGITMGIGMALMEATRIDPNNGRGGNGNVSAYLMPGHADIPDLQTIFVEEQDRMINPAGIKGIGELPIVGAAAAVGNPGYQATGVRGGHLP